MSFIKVTAGDLESTASQLNSASQTIAETSQTAMNQVNALVGDGWVGGGSTAFQSAMAEWQQGATMVHDALATISGLVTSASGSYTDTDSSVASSFG